MTTTPTPDQQDKDWRTLCDELTALTAERDQALARVKELEAEPGSFASWVVERHRAEKAEALVKAMEIDGALWDEQHAQQHRVNGDLAAERDRLKAKLDVATDALHDVCDYHAGERSCRFTYSEPDNGPCDCHVDQARAALAKIKETP